MLMKFYDNSHEAWEDDMHERIYKTWCPECDSVELVDVNYKSEWIDASEEVTITLECCKCGTRFEESGIKLEIYKAEYDEDEK